MMIKKVKELKEAAATGTLSNSVVTEEEIAATPPPSTPSFPTFKERQTVENMGNGTLSAAGKEDNGDMKLNVRWETPTCDNPVLCCDPFA